MTLGLQPQPLTGRADVWVSRVLLVDGDRDLLDTYASHLRCTGRHVTATTDPLHAWELALASPPDIIVMDIRLQRGFDGLELTHRLRVHPTTMHVPIVVLTSFVFPQTNNLATLAGCTAYLSKPCTPDALLESIQKIDRRRGSSPQISGRPTA